MNMNELIEAVANSNIETKAKAEIKEILEFDAKFIKLCASSP